MVLTRDDDLSLLGDLKIYGSPSTTDALLQFPVTEGENIIGDHRFRITPADQNQSTNLRNIQFTESGPLAPLPFSIGDRSYVLTLTGECGATNAPPTADAGDDQTLESVSPEGTAVTLDGSGSFDPDEDDLTYSWTLGDEEIATGESPEVVLLYGAHALTLTVSDGSETDTDEVVVTIVDTTPPVIEVAADPTELWPPNHKYHVIELTVSASDNADPSVALVATAVSSEPDEVKGNGDGKTTGDIKVTTAEGEILLSSNEAPVVTFDPVTGQLELRAERAGSGPGRVYTIAVTATDHVELQTVATATVTVPHDQGKKKTKKPVLEPEVLAFDVANYPNPFNPSMVIRYTLPEAAGVRLRIYDMLGQHVRTMVDAGQGAGMHSVVWDGRDALGRMVSTGLYFYRLEAGQNVAVRKMILAK